jgi:hypothetical protein
VDGKMGYILGWTCRSGRRYVILWARGTLFKAALRKTMKETVEKY